MLLLPRDVTFGILFVLSIFLVPFAIFIGTVEVFEIELDPPKKVPSPISVESGASVTGKCGPESSSETVPEKDGLESTD